MLPDSSNRFYFKTNRVISLKYFRLNLIVGYFSTINNSQLVFGDLPHDKNEETMKAMSGSNDAKKLLQTFNLICDPFVPKAT